MKLFQNDKIVPKEQIIPKNKLFKMNEIVTNCLMQNAEAAISLSSNFDEKMEQK